MAILSSDDYPAIRAALDVGLTSDVLSDSVIGLTIYKTAAETEVLRLDPAAEDRTGTDATQIKIAAIYLCAALLAPAVPRLTSQSISGTSFSVKVADWDARARQLRGDALALIETVTGSDPVAHFGRATGGRGQW